MSSKQKQVPEPRKVTAAQAIKRTRAKTRAERTSIRGESAEFQVSKNPDREDINPDDVFFTGLPRGIRGFRITFAKVGRKCVFSNIYANLSHHQAYRLNAGGVIRSSNYKQLQNARNHLTTETPLVISLAGRGMPKDIIQDRVARPSLLNDLTEPRVNPGHGRKTTDSPVKLTPHRKVIILLPGVLNARLIQSDHATSYLI